MIKFKSRSTQSVQPKTHIKSPISEVSAKKKRANKRLMPVMPDAELLASEEGRLRICNVLALLEISESGLWRRIDAGYFPAPQRDTRPYWLAPTVRAYMGKPPETHVREFYERLIEKHPKLQAIHRASMRAALRNMARARAESRQKKRQALAQ
jgi:predicted DNA-binding transcriptional regulator AlpA